MVSGVYYAAVPDGSAPLVLRKPKYGDEGGGRGEDGGLRDDDGDFVVYPREGQLVMFPPWLVHGVPMVREGGDGEDGSLDLPRVSFAFNVCGAYLGDPWDLTKIVDE